MQRQSRCDDHVHVVEIVLAAGMDKAYDTDDDSDDDTDDGGRGNLYTIKVPGGKVCVPKIGSGSLFVARTKNQAFD